ncbi:FMN-binding protein [Desulfosudis oleivorans]|uniref:Na(+)-translocating NADH-quinone reductase subunit C n=1 Tax=Desulfosudis oleivorans (strain DSM 6200 / JCM 39069 / Hxd3) TaxID=96561 RepID=A8ZWA8_DESOH|nr:FMN-binding protein [Desulfosudis oleivorans]ABW68342.1 NADH:ubiquinone oxidoreductase, subunit C [Desulfosudis oleivorans Hxd3]
MSDALKSIVFALVLCVVCSALLTGAAVGLKPYQLANVRIDRQKNILKSAGLLREDEKQTPAEIEKLFNDRIRCLRLTPDGRPLEPGESHAKALQVYLNIGAGQMIENYIIPIDTKGVWGEIKGYLALADDGKTVSGFTVYQHSETPGLGGEIEKAWFQKNFVGKKIVNAAGDFVSVAVAKGTVKDQVAPDRQANYVDGISGATLTGRYLSKGLETILREYEPVSVKFRKDHFKMVPPDQGTCDKKSG